MLSARRLILGLQAGLHHLAAGFLLHAPHHAATLVALQVLQLCCCRLDGSYVLLRRGISQAIGPQHAGDGSPGLLNGAYATGLASSRRATNGVVDLALIGLGDASHGSQLLGVLDEGDAIDF